MFTSKLTTCLLVLSVAGFYVSADDQCVCDNKLVDGKDAQKGSDAAGGIGGVGNAGAPGCPG